MLHMQSERFAYAIRKIACMWVFTTHVHKLCNCAGTSTLAYFLCIYSLKVSYIMEEAQSDPEADKLERGASSQPAWLWLLPTVL